jgi:protein gp138
MSRGDEDLGDVILQGVDGRLLDVHTQLRGNVVSYDEATKTCEVVIGTKMAVPNGEGGFVFQAIPNLTHVPVAWPSAGGFLLHWPLTAGDSVCVTFDEQDAQRWEASGQVSEPGWLERFGLSSALAHPYSRKPIATSGAGMVCPSPFSFGDPAAAHLLARADKNDANFQKIVDMFSHWVVVPNDGGGALKTLASSLAFDATSVTKLKAE